MRDDIETLRNALVACADSLEGELSARYGDIVHPALLSKWNSDMQDVYEAREALGTLDRIIADRDSLRKALDDRHAADKKAWSAIMRATGKERGLPDNKEVIAFYVADNERLEKERDEFAKQFCDLRCSRDDYRSERDSLRAKLDRATVAMEPYVKDAENWLYGTPRDLYQDTRRLVAVYAKLSADAPAPPQISDDARSLLDEAIAALVRAEPVVSAFTFKNPKWKPWQGDWQDPHGGHAALEEIRATLAKLRAARPPHYRGLTRERQALA